MNVSNLAFILADTTEFKWTCIEFVRGPGEDTINYMNDGKLILTVKVTYEGKDSSKALISKITKVVPS